MARPATDIDRSSTIPAPVAAAAASTASSHWAMGPGARMVLA